MRGRGSPRVGVSALGVAGALVIHALIVLPFVLNLSLPSQRRPNTTGTGASAFVSAAEPDMTVVLINELSPIENAAPPKPPLLASRGIAPPDLPLVVFSPDPYPAATPDSTGAPDQPIAAAESAEHARLHGRYLGQVQARIERAWMRPRTEIGAPRFSCRARIEQDRRGDVIRVDLDHCNGPQRWQQSLLSAIRTASPLPAPPDVSVYADILWLSFLSEGFQEGGSAQGFEPQTSQSGLVNDSEIARQSFEQSVSAARRMFRANDKKDSKVIHLTIVGSPAPGASPPNELPPDPLPPPIPQSPAAETLPQ